jgi:hypothetical protein
MPNLVWCTAVDNFICHNYREDPFPVMQSMTIGIIKYYEAPERYSFTPQEAQTSQERLQLMCAFAEILGSMGCSPICLPS